MAIFVRNRTVVWQFLSGIGPGLGVYCVAGWYSSAFGPGLGNIADKAERETMVGSTDPLAVASDDLFRFKSSTISSTEGGWDTSPCDTATPSSLVPMTVGMESGTVAAMTSKSTTIDVASIIASFAVGFVGFGFSSAAVAMTGLVSCWSDAVAFASAANASVAASFSAGLSASDLILVARP
jgi:hypothetical protein